EQRKGTIEQKRNKAAERMKKRTSEDRLTHWMSRQTAMVLPNVSVFQAWKEKIHSAIKRHSRQNVLRCSAISPKVTKLEDAKDQSKKSDGIDHRVDRLSRLNAPNEREVLKPKLLNRWSMDIGLSWVQLERVNPKSFSRHSS
ncbi:hypothetical protein H5410_050914, partial [Solanum commersonii]